MARRLPRPRWGQHFLHDAGVLERIASAIRCAPEELVVEIGPGEGALTDLLLARPARVTAIEIDTRLAARLRARHAESTLLEVLDADILDLDLGALISRRSETPAVVTGNLPYYISSPILRQVLSAASHVSEAVFLVQEEVARRIVSGKGSRDYGFLSVLCRLYAESELLFSVSPGAFRPPPKVSSALVRLKMRQARPVDAGFVDFLKHCFRQPRKTLLNNLSTAFPRDQVALLDASRMRAQQLDLDELRGVWKQLAETQSRTETK